MKYAHWTDEDVINYLYEVGPERGHLDECAACADRVNAAQARRTGEAVEMPLGFYIAQRQRIVAAAQRPRFLPHGGRVTAGLAALALIGFGLFFEQSPTRQPVAAPSETQLAKSDAQFFAEVSSLAEGTEPRAGAPIRQLFGE